MQIYQLPYGKEHINFQFDDDHVVDWIAPHDTPPAIDPLTEVASALDHFVDGGSIEQYPGVGTVAIAVNDKTRPVPHHHMLPPLMSRLQQMGIKPENILILVATGTHKPILPDEYARILPREIIEQYPIQSHNCDDDTSLVFLGETPHGTPVSINRKFLEADLRIVVGNIEPHAYMGFSGGAKTAAIGLAGRETICTNHMMLMHPNSILGNYETNPIRQDMEDIGRLVDTHLALNVVLNTQKEIVRALAGSPLAVIQAGIDLARGVCQTPVNKMYDLVVASPGGAPKDINLYQSQKAIAHASMIIRDGGVLILVAACPEGSGSTEFEHFMQGVHSYEEVFEKMKRDGFDIGPHKAFQIARDGRRLHILLLSELPEQQVRDFLLQPVSSAAEALVIAKQMLPPAFTSAVLPKATQTIPKFSLQ